MNSEERPREAPAAGPQQAPASEEEMRARIEEQLRKVRVQDLLLESVVSVINLAARRIAKEDERDLEQARVGIEAVRAVVDLLDPEPAQQVRSALSEVQVLYAKQDPNAWTTSSMSVLDEANAAIRKAQNESAESASAAGPESASAEPAESDESLLTGRSKTGLVPI